MGKNNYNFIENCCAVTADNKRCNKPTISSSYHCQEHYSRAKRLYKKYKKLSDKAYNLDINKYSENDSKTDKNIYNKKKQKYLLKCYNLFSKAYKARENHRKYAFVKECHDYGHNLQFKILKKKMEICESLLNELFVEKNNSNQKQITNYLVNTSGFLYKNIKETGTNKESENKIVITNKKNKSNFKNRKKRRKCDNLEIKRRREQEEIAIMDAYIEAKELELEETMKLVNLIVKAMNQIVLPFFPDHDDLYMVYIMLFHLTSRLDGIGYFRNFKPETCKECNCGSFAIYELRLLCECALYHYDIEEYLCTINRSILKMFYKDLLYHKIKIGQVFIDAIKHYKFFGNSLINNEFELQWDKDIKRLKVDISETYEYEKYSRALASQRLKKKLLIKRYGLQYISSDSSSDEYSDYSEYSEWSEYEESEDELD